MAGLYKLTPGTYVDTLRAMYLSKIPLMVRGAPGIGKSAIPRQVGRQIAEEKRREFIEWGEQSIDQKSLILKTPEKYFVFYDARTSQMDTTSLQGIPNMAKADMLENIPYSWAVYFTKPGADGILFFDEINLAPPVIQAISYQVINDRVIADRRIAEDVWVMAAGNRAVDKANTFDMPLPLRDRFAECEMEHNTDAWLDWARAARINPHVTAFITWKPSSLYRVDDKTANKPITPRGVVRAAKLLDGLPRGIDDKMANAVVSMAVGDSWAAEFEAYTKLHHQINWDQVFKDPTIIKTWAVDMQYALMGGLADRFAKMSKDRTKDALWVDIFENMRTDLAISCARMFKDIDMKAVHELIRGPQGSRFHQKYFKFLR